MQIRWMNDAIIREQTLKTEVRTTNSSINTNHINESKAKTRQ